MSSLNLGQEAELIHGREDPCTAVSEGAVVAALHAAQGVRTKRHACCTFGVLRKIEYRGNKRAHKEQKNSFQKSKDDGILELANSIKWIVKKVGSSDSKTSSSPNRG